MFGQASRKSSCSGRRSLKEVGCAGLLCRSPSAPRMFAVSACASSMRAPVSLRVVGTVFAQLASREPSPTPTARASLSLARSLWQMQVACAGSHSSGVTSFFSARQRCWHVSRASPSTPSFANERPRHSTARNLAATTSSSHPSHFLSMGVSSVVWAVSFRIASSVTSRTVSSARRKWVNLRACIGAAPALKCKRTAIPVSSGIGRTS
mmetsp:Transcript_115816/g.368222  ORF Transcript_115816/g.368222 Transcript_115816/m.368222 type:complete len:208 (+) Transcript_115816:4769-5392(+)